MYIVFYTYLYSIYIYTYSLFFQLYFLFCGSIDIEIIHDIIDIKYLANDTY